MSDTSFFRIPGNVKQSVLPFVLNRESKLNKIVTSSTYLKDVKFPQVFTFRSMSNFKTDKFDSGVGQINFIPTSVKNILNEDLSFNVLFDKNGQNISFDSYLEQLPKIQIREFLPDTQLDQCINIFNDILEALGINLPKNLGDLGNAVKNLFTGKKTDPNGNKLDEQTNLTLMEKVKLGTKTLIEYFIGDTAPNIYSDLTTSTLGTEFLNNNEYQRINMFLMKFPYLMYYRLQSTTSTNIYEIPAIITNKEIAKSDGTQGWTGQKKSGLSIENIPGLKHLPGANSIFGNISISFMPWWDASVGRQTGASDVEINFDLINDSSEAAMINFIFVNTLVPNNKFIQYSIFTHAPHLYDIKLDGYNRLFACAGQHTVTYDGILRNPPEEWVDFLCKKYASKGYVKDETDIENFKSYLINNNIIKIPDVYHVKMIFKSLLPDNFNQFLFQYNNNYDIISGKIGGGMKSDGSSGENSTTIYQSSIFPELLGLMVRGVKNKYNNLAEPVIQAKKAAAEAANAERAAKAKAEEEAKKEKIKKAKNAKKAKTPSPSPKTMSLDFDQVEIY